MKTTTPQFTTTPKVSKIIKPSCNMKTSPSHGLEQSKPFKKDHPIPPKLLFPTPRPCLLIPGNKQQQICPTMKATEESGKHRTLYKQAKNHPAPWRRLFTADILQSPPPMGHADFAPQSRIAFKRRMSPRCTKAKNLPQVLGYLQYLRF